MSRGVLNNSSGEQPLLYGYQLAVDNGFITIALPVAA
jgi:hypothetical protein